MIKKQSFRGRAMHKSVSDCKASSKNRGNAENFTNKSRHGQILVMVAAGMVMLMSIAGLAVDVGIWYKDQRTLEHAAELAAMSGYKALLEERGSFIVNDDGTLGDCSVKTAIENSLKTNGIYDSEVTSATIKMSKSGQVEVSLTRKSPALFTRIQNKENTLIAGLGGFETNRLAPFAIPEQYNDEDRDQRPNYKAEDTANQLVNPPYADFANCAYVPGNPYILLYSVSTNPTTNDWVVIPMDDDMARIPIGTGDTGSMGVYEVSYDTVKQGGTLQGTAHLPYPGNESAVYSAGDLDNGSNEYVLWQDTALTINADQQVDKLYTYSLFRAYGVMWDILGAPAVDGLYPYVRWLKGFHGGAFAVERRFLESAGFTLQSMMAPDGYNRADYRKIIRTSNPQGLTKGKARQLGDDTGVRCILLRFGDYDNAEDASELDYVQHRIRSWAFWRWLGRLNQEGQIKSIEFGKTTTSEATRIQPVIGTYTGTTDPVTRVLSWAGIPFDAFFGDYNPRVTLDPNSSCLESYKLFDEVSFSGAYLADAQTILDYLRQTQGYHWLHVHHENFARNIETDETTKAMAWAIRRFVQDGGFLFDACLGAETLETALAYIEQGGGAPDCQGDYSALTKTLAHNQFTIRKVPPFYEARIAMSSGEIADIAGMCDPPTYPSTIFGSFTLTDTLNSRSQNHKGFGVGCNVIDYDESSGTGPAYTLTNLDLDPINVYTGSFMSFREQLMRTCQDPVEGKGLEALSDELNRDVIYTLGRFHRSHCGTVTANDVDALIYLSGTIRKDDGSQGGQYAMIGGHLPHHGSPNEETDYDITVREYFVEGAWYHPTATHFPWKIKKVYRGHEDDRGDGKYYNSPTTNVPDPTSCDEDIIIAWRGLLDDGDNFGFYIEPGGYWEWGEGAHWNTPPSGMWKSGWINGEWDPPSGPRWDGDPPHWDSLPIWGSGGQPRWLGDAPHWDGDPPHWLGGGPQWVSSPGWDGDPPHWSAIPGWTDGGPRWEPAPSWTVEPTWERELWWNGDSLWVMNPEYGGYWDGQNEWKGQWVGGTWDPGNWESGTWYGGNWVPGVWDSGIWQAGNWIAGNWIAGSWYSGDWEGGDWYGGTWIGANWTADWWRQWWWYGGDWDAGTPDQWLTQSGWTAEMTQTYYGVHVRHRNSQPLISKSACKDYYEVLANLNFTTSAWWSNPTPYGFHWMLDGNEEPGDQAATIWYSGTETGNNVMDFKGEITSGTSGWWATRLDTTNIPRISNRSEWGKGWPTLWDSPRDIDLDTATAEDLYDDDSSTYTGSGDPVSRIRSGYRRPCEASHILDIHGGEGSIGERSDGRAQYWKIPIDGSNRIWVECTEDTTSYPGWTAHKPVGDDAYDTLRKRFNRYQLYRFYKNNRKTEMYGSYFRNNHLSRKQWTNGANHARFLTDPSYFWQYTLGLPRWLIYQLWLYEEGHIEGVEEVSGEPAETPILPVMENHGFDMVVRDLDNDGITGDIYEKGAIYRGVPDRAFHRLYLNNILLGALAAEMGNAQTGGVNCGAVNWEMMSGDAYASPGAGFGTNSFVDIMRLGIKGGGLRVGDTFKTAPADLTDAVDVATDYMFTDNTDVRVDRVSTVKWEDFATTYSAPSDFYRYRAAPGTNMRWNDNRIFNSVDNTILPNEGDFIRRPAQIMTIGVVERTDGNYAPCEKSIYYSPPNGLGDEITVKVIGFARFFIIDRENDTLTYLANPGDTHFSVPSGTTTGRETVYLGPDPALDGELRGHFLGWEVRPPTPGTP